MNDDLITPVPAELSAEENTAPIPADEPFGDEPVGETEPMPTAEEGAAAKEADREDDTQQLNERLADEFRALCKEVPEITAVSDLPDAVFEMAVDRHISLFDAFLRHRFYEDRRIGKAMQAERAAAEMSTGSLAAPPDTPHPEVDAFVSELRRSLR